MKYQRHNNTSSLFLLELILAVLFFSVASALCIQIFTKAHLMSQDARDLNFAVNEVSSMAEQMSDGTLQDAVYVLTVHYEPEDTLLKAHISMDTIADNRNIYALDVTKHRQRRAES